MLEKFIAAGLYDPESPHAEERKELLEYLLGRGFTAREIIDTADRLSQFTDVAAVIGKPPAAMAPLSDLAREAGAPVEDLAEFRRALGFPATATSPTVVPQTVVDDFALYQLACAQFGKEPTLAFCRVLGLTVSTLIEAGRELFAGSVRGTRATELEIALANEVADAAWLALRDVVGHLMWEWRRRDVWFETSLIRGDLDMAVAFIDLVGSVSWAAGRSPGDHARALARFEQIASDLALAWNGRVVKFIGDEAMIVTPDPTAAVEIALGLCEATEAEADLPTARGAVGFGAVIARSGDYFGDLVNLVARATKAAPANAVVVTAEVVARLDPARFAARPLDAVGLRGLDRPVELWEVTASTSAPTPLSDT